jgi:hypothetical protein
MKSAFNQPKIKQIIKRIIKRYTGRDIVQDLEIDQYALDKNCSEQPLIMFAYGKGLSRILAKYKAAEESLELLCAELDKDIRNNPNQYGIKKVAEAAIMAAVQSSRSYVKAKIKLGILRYEKDIMFNAVKAIEQRKDMLSELGRLYAREYFATPTICYDDRQRKTIGRSGIKIGLNR